MSKRYPIEQREPAVKILLDHLHEYNSLYAACPAIGPKLGLGAELLRVWTKQAQIDGHQVPGATSAERQRITDLETGTKMFFADPRSPWQRPTNEKHQRAFAATLPEGHRPLTVVRRRPRSSRARAEQPTPQKPRL